VRSEAERVSVLLSETVDGSVPSDATLARRMAHDLRFQAELAQYRRLLRALRGLRVEIVDPGHGLVDEVLAALDAYSARQDRGGAFTPRRAACLGGLAAATAAGVGTALVLARRRVA
jgi:glyoxylase-like metal-dependent hydrolase (beta-lactamase superfamily II)